MKAYFAEENLHINKNENPGISISLPDFIRNRMNDGGQDDEQETASFSYTQDRIILV